VLKSRKKIFSYTGAVMTLPTGVQAVAAARYGAPENALEYLQKLNRSFSYALPGSMYEVSPDFGMVTQAWNLYGVAVPLVHYFFGIDPHAPDQKIKLAPRFPQSWNEATISDVRIGANSFGVAFKRQPDHHLYTLTQTIEDWNIEMEIPRDKKIFLNDQEIEAAQLVNGKLNITGKSNVVKIYR
jgi:hypothetical protein